MRYVYLRRRRYSRNNIFKKLINSQSVAAAVFILVFIIYAAGGGGTDDSDRNAADVSQLNENSDEAADKTEKSAAEQYYTEAGGGRIKIVLSPVTGDESSAAADYESSTNAGAENADVSSSDSGAAPSMDELRRMSHHDVTVLKDDGTVESVPIEAYVACVVASEMPASFGPEALKAQAVAARTYVEARRHQHASGKGKHPEACVCSSTCCQVYHGEERLRSLKSDKWYESDFALIRKAAASTAGQMLYYNGELVQQPLFFSASGGRTENSEDVFAGAVPYLRSVSSTYDSAEKYTDYRTTLPAAEAAAAVLSYASEHTASVYTYDHAHSTAPEQAHSAAAGASASSDTASSAPSHDNSSSAPQTAADYSLSDNTLNIHAVDSLYGPIILSRAAVPSNIADTSESKTSAAVTSSTAVILITDSLSGRIELPVTASASDSVQNQKTTSAAPVSPYASITVAPVIPCTSVPAGLELTPENTAVLARTDGNGASYIRFGDIVLTGRQVRSIFSLPSSDISIEFSNTNSKSDSAYSGSGSAGTTSTPVKSDSGSDTASDAFHADSAPAYSGISSADTTSTPVKSDSASDSSDTASDALSADSAPAYPATSSTDPDATSISTDSGTQYITFITQGNGHRVGLSQYGAAGMAANGSSYIEILQHYYSGTDVK